MRFGLIVAAACLAAGCSDSSSPPASDGTSKSVSNTEQVIVQDQQTKTSVVTEDPWHVIEAFEVGREIYVRSLALEADRNAVWVGTSAGVHEVDLATQELRDTFTRADGLANEYVFAIFVDSNGNKWFGTNGGGVSRYNNGEWQVLFPMHGLADYWVYSFGQQADGGLWIGTWAGVNYLPPDGGKMKTYFNELVNEWVYGIGVDSQQRVWFGTEGGVSMFDGQQWHEWTHKDGLGAPNESNLPISLNTGLGTRSRHDLNVDSEGQATYNPNYIFSLLVDKNDAVWAGTWGGGVSRFDGEAWHNYSSKDGLIGNVVYSIAEGEDGSLWFGTNHGLSRFDGKNWYSYGRKDGVLSDHVYAISVVSDDEVWIGTRGGVTRLAATPQKVDAGEKNED